LEKKASHQGGNLICSIPVKSSFQIPISILATSSNIGTPLSFL
jgi:hypothetical protein